MRAYGAGWDYIGLKYPYAVVGLKDWRGSYRMNESYSTMYRVEFPSFARLSAEWTEEPPLIAGHLIDPRGYFSAELY